MFRKQKTIAPYFRMPNPHNPITGQAEYLHPPLKQYTSFKLTEALATTDENKKAEITDARQWGPDPIYHVSGVDIHVHNQLADDDTAYLFEGAVGDVGIALHDYANHWRIIWMVPTGGGSLNSVATTSVIIPARSGSVPGGPVTVTRRGFTEGVFGVLGTVDCYSWIRHASADPAIEPDEGLGAVLWIFIEQDEGGMWWFTGQDCPVGSDPPP